jgi:hypothetical protein
MRSQKCRDFQVSSLQGIRRGKCNEHNKPPSRSRMAIDSAIINGCYSARSLDCIIHNFCVKQFQFVLWLQCILLKHCFFIFKFWMSVKFLMHFKKICPLSILGKTQIFGKDIQMNIVTGFKSIEFQSQRQVWFLYQWNYLIIYSSQLRK